MHLPPPLLVASIWTFHWLRASRQTLYCWSQFERYLKQMVNKWGTWNPTQRNPKPHQILKIPTETTTTFQHHSGQEECDGLGFYVTGDWQWCGAGESMTHAEQVCGGQENEESSTQLGRTTGGSSEVQKKQRQGKFLISQVLQCRSVINWYHWYGCHAVRRSEWSWMNAGKHPRHVILILCTE